jgi:hypothetical protein
VFDRERSQAPLVRRRRVTYFGFELEREDEPVREWRGAAGPEARRTLAAALASGEAMHPAVRRNQRAIDEVREVWRRSAGATPRLGLAELTALYERALGGVEDVHQWRAARLALDLDTLVSREERVRWLRLPGAAEIDGRTVPIEYDVEEDASGNPVGVARLRLTERTAHQIDETELPQLDRPLRFVVYRGARQAVRASSLDELRQALEEAPRERGERDHRQGRAGHRPRHGAGKARGRHGKPPWRGRPRRGR